LASGAQSDEPFEPFDLSAVASEVVNRFERRSGREIRLDSVETPVVAQRASVQRAISCLLDNARKFDQSDGGIIVTVRDSGVTVRDHGPGIPEDELSRVFDRFHRAESARTMPGSGLGLSIVREIAERHDGTATAQNAPDGGAVVGFRLGR
jgi:two-component system sensor histidine kinase MprB